jgi:stringent starvation protein B
LEFSGRFAGIPTPVYVPIGAVIGIYARENGQGMVFDPEKPQPPSPKAPQAVVDVVTKPAAGNGKLSRPSLRVVK